MPEPMIPEMTIIVASKRVRRRAKVGAVMRARSGILLRRLGCLSPPTSTSEDSTGGLLAHAAVVRGRIEAANGDRVAAQAAWERALALLAPCHRPLTFWRVLSPWAQAELSLDRLDEGRPAVERLRGMGFVSRELEKLVRAKGLR
jgi:hypothetical protein